MLKSDVIAYYESPSRVAQALGISSAAVSQWRECVPPLRAAQLQKLTRGKLRFDPADYPGYWRAGESQDAA